MAVVIREKRYDGLRIREVKRSDGIHCIDIYDSSNDYSTVFSDSALDIYITMLYDIKDSSHRDTSLYARRFHNQNYIFSGNYINRLRIDDILSSLRDFMGDYYSLDKYKGRPIEDITKELLLLSIEHLTILVDNIKKGAQDD